MSEECNSCLQVKNLEDKIKSLWHVYNEAKIALDKLEKRVTELEITRVETKEQLNSIKEFLERIEESIKSLTMELVDIKAEPLKKYENLKWIIVTALISSGFGFIVSIMTKK